MRIHFFEDTASADFTPIALMRPVFELLCGQESLRRRVLRWFPCADWGVSVRPILADVYREEFPAANVNRIDWLAGGDTLIINGRWLPRRRLHESTVTHDRVGFVGNEVAWIRLQPHEAHDLNDSELGLQISRIAETRDGVDAGGIMVSRPWDLVNHNRAQLEFDFAERGINQCFNSEGVDDVRCLGAASDIYISPLATIDPFVVIDARTGPVSIDQDVHIQSFTRIEGPCHIGSGTHVFRALIHGGTTIGPVCRVGGEIDEAILHAFVNKYHEGFLGHSYVCPWVNLGAITTTSDLKNDYGPVRVPQEGIPIDTGTAKVGSFIGDHTKTAIDSMFNTGSSIGVMSMVLPGGRLLPRHIPSFSNVSFGELRADWPLEQSISTAAVAMSRRGQQLTRAQDALLHDLYEQTEDERQDALDRANRRRLRRTGS